MRLKVLSLVATVIGGLVLGGCLMRKYDKKKEDGLQNRINVLSDHFQLLNHWLEIKGEGKSTANYFEEMGYRHIAVYGMAELAIRLCEDLEGSMISVDYGMDRDISCSMARIREVYSPEDDLPETDVIVVTPYAAFDEIKKVLDKKVTCPIISLENVVWSV